ncbi:MAG: helix-hairpin-helix domain-containing protein [Wenzhouxiangellaceae bacterium]
MHPSRVRRDRLGELTDLPNVGPKVASALFRIGIDLPSDLIGRDPFELYQDYCQSTGQREDPCVLDVFLSISRFMNGEEPRRWWEYTAERKRKYPDL